MYQNPFKFKVDPLSSNIDSIELAPYDHYFYVIEKIIASNYVPLSKDEINISSSKDELNNLVCRLSNGFSILKSSSTLPKVVRKSIIAIENRLDNLFPSELNKNQYKNSNLKDNDQIAFEYIQSCINNTAYNSAFIDVSIQCGNFESAFRQMAKIRIQNKTPLCLKNKSIIVSSQVFEPSINLLSHRGKLSAIINLLNEMDNLSLLPSVNIIMRSLEAVGRKAEIDTNTVNRLLNYLKHHKVSLREAFLKSYIKKDSFQYIIKSVKSVQSEFTLVNNLKKLVHKKGNKSLSCSSLNSSCKELNDDFKKQLKTEEKINTIKHIFPLGKEKKANKNKLKMFIDEWKHSLLLEFNKQMENIDSNSSSLKPFLICFKSDIYVNIMLKMFFRLVRSTFYQFCNINVMTEDLGKEVFNVFEYNCLKRDNYFTKLEKTFNLYLLNIENNPQNSDLSSLWEACILDNINEGNLTRPILDWNGFVTRDIGQFLYQIMSKSLFYHESETDTPEPILSEKLMERLDNIDTIINVNPSVYNLLQSLNSESVDRPAEELPMLHPPVPICNGYTTGYFYSRNYSTRIIREVDSKLFDDDLEQHNDISQIYNAMNTLGLCGWTIDDDNFNLVKRVFQNNGNLKLKIPVNFTTMKKPKITDFDNNKNKFRSALTEFTKSKNEMNSLWLTLLYKLNVAEKFRGQNFWFPYSMDFRGRVYPCSPIFNHIGDDVSRGLVKFARAKPLGPKGLDWLKIHCINLYGSHKRNSNEERLQAANNNINEIINSALKPLDGNKWWQEGEKPWQILMVCREILKALQYGDEMSQGDHESFMSQVGIHQDGSCNGLQHYAALSRDKEGAQAVNLTDLEKPQDVYSDVLYYVEETRKKDALEGIKEAQILEGLVHRKIIKQTVMTTVYGVTNYGAKDQILKQLKSAYDLSNDDLIKCSNYLAKVTLNSIGQLFKSATQIQNWLTECAANIASERAQNIQWKTPLNLVVTQPYFKNGYNINKAKNRNAFPPNFIHSLDSSHMMLTALRCWEQDVTFVSVHDCFWTHACDVDRMNKICREEFIQLYSQPILQNLSDYFLSHFGFSEDSNLTLKQKNFNQFLRNIPEEGTFDIKEVLNSTYFFS